MTLVKQYFDRAGNKVGDAIRDMQTGSFMITSVLRQRIYPVPVYTLDGVATAVQAGITQSNMLVLHDVCPSLLPTGGFAVVFGNDTSDLIVSGTSQQAVGLAYNGGNPGTTISNGLIHAVAPFLFTKGPDVLSNDIHDVAFVVGANTVNPQKVILLLNEPVDSGAFINILP